MTKQEKIQEAYGEYYDRIKLHINENGWIDTQTFSFSRKGIDFEQYKKRSNTYLGFYNRPKSLQGIEDNNGWIKIESEGDLPKQSGMYWTFIIGKEVVANTFNTFGNNEFTFDNGVVTHYQPIEKPKPPIY